jgi:RelA/SpoT family (p)ppGpp synthetase
MLETKNANDHQYERYLISDFCQYLEINNKLTKEQVKMVYDAYLYAAQAHIKQFRKSGEPYIYHPLSVSKILAEMNMDVDSLIAGLLHDVIEDTEISKQDIINKFGETVAHLVDGVSKLNTLEFNSKAEEQAENFRKMLMAMTDDIRVILIKLADRLHNMRTLGAMPRHKKREKARETLEIFSPIAYRLGMNTLRTELEDLGFLNLHPNRYKVLKKSVVSIRGNREKVLQKIEVIISAKLQDKGISSEVLSREKHLYSIFKKMKDKQLSFNEVQDTFGIRVVVDTIDECYRALGLIHNLYKPIPGKFKDYIALPKINAYQSIHTALFAAHDVPVEVQIRTKDMDRFADCGIAAHWLYKESDSDTRISIADDWLRSLLEMQQKTSSSIEFLENVKVDLFPDKVFVFSPKGQIYPFTRGATALDFAYAVHSDLGKHCMAVRIDHRRVPTSSELLNGQTIEIITADHVYPNALWLNFTKTVKARTAIKNSLKELKDDEAALFGLRLVKRELAKLKLNLDQISEKHILEIVAFLGFKERKELWMAVGLGNIIPALIAQRLINEDQQIVTIENSSPIAIAGTEGMVVNFAKCCNPIPGDLIQGMMSTGKGVLIHRTSCGNIAEFKNHPEKWLDVGWSETTKSNFTAQVKLDLVDKRGVLAKITTLLSDKEINIENIKFHDSDGFNTVTIFYLSVKSAKHLNKIIAHLEGLDDIIRVRRQ